MKIIRLREMEFVPAGHEDLKAPGVLIKVLLRKGDLPEGQLQMINWAKMEAGKSFRPHYHEDMVEVFILIRGRARIRVQEEESDLEKEEAVVLPMGKVHAMKNIGNEDVEYIVFGISQGKGGKTVVVGV